MAAATPCAIRCAKSGQRNDAVRCLIQTALVRFGAHHCGYADAGCGKQIVDMPAQGFLAPQMASHAGFEIALRRSGVDVIPSRKIELAQAADLQAQGLAQADVELVGAEQSAFVWSGAGFNGCFF